MPRCRLPTRNQIERHLKLDSELVAARPLAIGIAAMITTTARLAFDWHTIHPAERSDRAAREHACHPFRRGTIHHDDPLAVGVIRIARRDTHDCLGYCLPVSRSLDLTEN